MSPSPPVPRRTAVGAAVAALGVVVAAVGVVVAAVLAVVVAASPALAHDELLRSDPADGASLPAVPTEVRLTFAQPPTAVGLAVRVVGPSGDATVGSPVLDGSVVTQELSPGSPGGSYTVAWRVSADDGHPVSGQFSFSAQGPSPSPSVSPTTGASPGTSGVAGPSATVSLLDPPGAEPRSALPLLVIGGVILLGVVLSVLALVGRRHDLRTAPAVDGAPPTDGRTGPGGVT